MESAAIPRDIDWLGNELLLENAMGLKGRAIGVCAMMGFGYVAILYLPSLFLPRATSVREHMLRRFSCAVVASALAPFITLQILPVHLQWDEGSAALLEIFGLRTDHLWQAALLPTILTAILYLGPLLLALCGFLEWSLDMWQQEGHFFHELMSFFILQGTSLASDVLMWRNCLVAPVSEEVVFRACMVPLLMCGGFSASAVIFLGPMFFALAHIHHFWELTYQQKHDKSTAALIVGVQLCYTTVFGCYATFLYLRTGHLIAPLVAHIFCNTMGLPSIDSAMASSHRRGVGLAYLMGLVGFIALLGPMSDPRLYSEVPHKGDCYCWLGYCKWKLSGSYGNLVNSE